MEINIKKKNSTCGNNQSAKTIEEAKRIVNELIDEETVAITITQKEWNKGLPTRAF